MKKKTFYGVLVGLTLGIIIYSSEKSFASGGNKIIDKLYCKDKSGTTVSFGADCINGDSNCTANPCPPGTNIE